MIAFLLAFFNFSAAGILGFDHNLQQEPETEEVIPESIFEAAKRLKLQGRLKPKEDALDPYSAKFHSDIALEAEETSTFFHKIRRRSAISYTYRHWSKAEIPYSIALNRYSSSEQIKIAGAINEFHEQTCIRFVPRGRHSNYIYIHPSGNGCYSYVGRIGGRQEVSLDSWCVEQGTIMHELMHAIGFYHEHNRHDRDKYIAIQWYNIKVDRNTGEDYKYQFEKYHRNAVADLGEEYDYASLMHYHPRAFSGVVFNHQLIALKSTPLLDFVGNGRRTIIGLKSGSEKMGQRTGLSETDVKRLRKLYKCPEIKIATTTPKTTTTTAKPTTTARPTTKTTTKTTTMVTTKQTTATTKATTTKTPKPTTKTRANIKTEPKPTTTLKPAVQPSENCRDLDGHACVNFLHKYCWKFPYIRLICPKTCGVCKLPPTVAAKVESACTNRQTDRRCRFWVKNFGCDAEHKNKPVSYWCQIECDNC